MCKVLKKFIEANTIKMDKNLACENPHFAFYAGQFTGDIVFQKSHHAKDIHALKLMRVAHIFLRVDEIGTA